MRVDEPCRARCGRYNCKWNAYGACDDLAPCERQTDSPDEPDPDERRDWRDFEA